MITTICPAIWGGKTRITKNASENWFYLYITENDSNHGPSNDVCVVLTYKQFESLRDTITTFLTPTEAAPGLKHVELAEK